MSDGRPTSLVRDHGVVTRDDPPASAPVVLPARIEGNLDAHDASDLKRADEAERAGPYSKEAAHRAVWDVIDRQGH